MVPEAFSEPKIRACEVRKVQGGFYREQSLPQERKKRISVELFPKVKKRWD